MTEALLEVTKRHILREGRFRMQDWGESLELAKGAACDSPACIAGHIVAAAVELGLYPEKSEFYSIGSYGRRIVDVNGAALHAWGKVYGKKEADRLDFVYWEDFPHACITPEMAIRHLDGESPKEIIEETRKASPSTTDWEIQAYWARQEARKRKSAEDQVNQP